MGVGLRDRVAGAVYGLALGDAMGMPPELWSRARARAFFGGGISDLLDGPQCSEVARNYKRGQFTDDTAQALIIVDSLASTGFVPDARDVARRLVEWADGIDAWNNGILGPTSKVALANFKSGVEDRSHTDTALSNGSAMRIPPVGCLFTPDRKKELARFVFEVSRVTHTSNVTVAGAAMVAGAVSSALVNDDFERVVEDALDMEPLGWDLGFDHFSPRLADRTRLALRVARKYAGDDEMFSRKVYDVVGTGVGIIEAVPAALAIAYYTREPNRAALMCANVGGDTDTIGAMATAICGAFRGASAIREDFRATLAAQNGVDFEAYVDVLLRGREVLA